jgi:ABC-type nitrate/sulfonate/bicarbonate transport system permease component
MMAALRGRALGIGTLALAVLAWELGARAAHSAYVPPVSQIAVAFAQQWIGPGFVAQAVPSLERMFAGYAIGAAIGIVVGLLVGTIPALRRTIDPVAQALRVLPAAAVIPVGILLFGIGDAMKVFVIAFGSLFPILVNSADGAASADPVRLDVARTFGLSRAQILARVVLPSALPHVFAGMRVALALAFIMIIISEMVGGTNGLGYTILSSQRAFAIPETYAGIVLLGILGFVLNAGFGVLERRLIGWHFAETETSF